TKTLGESNRIAGSTPEPYCHTHRGEYSRRPSPGVKYRGNHLVATGQGDDRLELHQAQFCATAHYQTGSARSLGPITVASPIVSSRASPRSKGFMGWPPEQA